VNARFLIPNLKFLA